MSVTTAPGDTVPRDDSSWGTPTREVWRRHPSDVARLVVALVALAVLLGIGTLADEADQAFARSVNQAFRWLPDPVTGFLAGFVQLAAILVPAAVLGSLALGRRWRLLATAVGAAVGAAVIEALIQSSLDGSTPAAVGQAQAADSWITGAAFPSGSFLAAVTAAVVVLGSAASRSWRRAATGTVAFAAFVRLASGLAGILSLGGTLALGAAVGSAALVAFGAPIRRIGSWQVLQGLRDNGFPAETVEEVQVGAQHSRTFMATAPRLAFVKLIGRDERDAEVFARWLRAVRVRGLRDERSAWSPLATVRNEALAASIAGNHGVAVAEVLAVGQSAGGDGLTVLAPVNGPALAEVDTGDVDHELLVRAWQQLAGLRAARIAHRWLDATHLRIVDGSPVVLDFRWAVMGASDHLLAVDVADLAVSLAGKVGVSRAVAAAMEVVDPTDLAAALPVMQPLVLSPGNRAMAKAQPELLGELRTAIATATGAGEVELEPVARLTVNRVVGWAGGAFLVYVGLAFVANWSEIGDALRGADWTTFPFQMALALLGFVTGAMTLVGSVPQRLPFGQTTEVMFAQSFLNKFTPANAGGMALRVRFLQLNGAGLTVAATAVGLNSAASGAVQVVLIVVTTLWAGTSVSVETEPTDHSGVVWIILLVMLIVGLALVIPAGRRLVKKRVVPIIRQGWQQLSEIAESPGRLALVFGGILIGKILNIVIFVLSCRALGLDQATAVLSLAYVTANTIAGAIPAPGGMGATEAAIVAVLGTLGVDTATAFAVAMMFRLSTYWIPIPFTWLALTHLRHKGVV